MFSCYSFEQTESQSVVIPAKAGIQGNSKNIENHLDPRLRGDYENIGIFNQ